MLKLIIQPSEIGAGTRGSSLGPDALRLASLASKNTRMDLRSVETFHDRNETIFDEVDTPCAIRIEPMVDVWKSHSDGVSSIAKAGDIPFLISADHASAGATIAGLRMAHPDKRIGVVWIDAHADLHSPYTSPSGNIHGMPLACSIADDNKESAHRTPTDAAVRAWNELKNLGGICPKINPDDIRFVGVRDTESQEEHLMDKYGIKNYEVAEARSIGLRGVGNNILDELAHCDLIYVSFDVDSMDPDMVSYGTGTPVKDGLSPAEANELIQCLLDDPRLCCFEMVEINPLLDNKCNAMAETAFEIFANAFEKLNNA